MLCGLKHLVVLPAHMKTRKGGWGQGSPCVTVQYCDVCDACEVPCQHQCSFRTNFCHHKLAPHGMRCKNGKSPETFRSRVKCRNYIDYIGNLTQDRNKMSAVLSVKSGEKIEILESFVWVSSPREAEVLGSVLEIWDSSVVLQMEKKEGMRLGFRYLSRLTET